MGLFASGTLEIQLSDESEPSKMSDDPGIVTVDPASPVVQPLFGISPALPENIEFDMKPVRTAFDVTPSVFPAKLGGFADPSQSLYAKRKGAFDSAVRGLGGTADRIWFFRGENFIRYFEHPEHRDDISGWLPMAENWPGLPANFTSQIDASSPARLRHTRTTCGCSEVINTSATIRTATQ